MIAKKYINILIDSLFKDGMDIINKAKETKEANNRSNNMEDAFGCAVYYRGKLVKRGYANPTPLSKGMHNGWDKYGIPPDTGRGYLNDFFGNFKPSSNGMYLVCVNAVFYAPILEDGKGFGNVKYRIITQTDYLFDSLASKYKGKVINLRK